MANSENIPPTVRRLSVLEAESLADRLYSRSLSIMFEASLEVRRDMCMASRAIRSLLSEYDRVASLLEDEAYRLRTLHIDVGGC
jgi:hypothetical protein